MKAIRIKILNFIDDHQPGFVECKFNDAWNKEHIVQEKVPVVTLKNLDANSVYPQDGVIACEIIKEWEDNNGRTIFTVTTQKPWAIDTVDGLFEFDILEEQIIELKK